MSGLSRLEYSKAASYLVGLKPRGTKFGIDRMRRFAAALDSPERLTPWVHIAGTNGKGSVSAMVEAIVRVAGWRVGLYTSPHLRFLGERVQVDRSALSEDRIIGYVESLIPVADRISQGQDADDRPSFFEFMTAMALLEFSRARCDLGILEVGLGGELDATNIVDPLVSVITSIGFDHCEYLGKTIQEIAQAKAGIIKSGRPLVLGRVPEEAESVIRKIAAEKGATVVSVRAEFGENIKAYPTTRLLGEYQRWNAATAVLAVRQLPASFRIEQAHITQGLASVNWAGRWQRLSVKGRTLILDASHNEEGARALSENLSALCLESGRAPIVVLGVLGSHRAPPLLESISRYAKEIHLVAPADPRATPVGELAELVPTDFNGRVVQSTVGEIFPGGGSCEIGGAGDAVVVTGSIYLLGEVMERLEISA